MTGACWHGRGDSLFYTFCRDIVLLVLGLPNRLRVSGADHVPLEGPLILAVTHKSETDPLFAGVAMGRPLAYMAKIELFRIWGLRQVVTALGAFPVDRGAGDRRAHDQGHDEHRDAAQTRRILRSKRGPLHLHQHRLRLQGRCTRTTP